MNARNFIAAAAVFALAGTAFAAETPEPAASATATAATTGSASSVDAAAARSDAKQETADFVKSYRTPLTIQLDQYKN
ncbi:MAG: hypothetical protein V7631_4021 [Massilia sp.]|jgi:hypothetical protein